tara:strand:- start:26 stop:358 length:333 start_codon:yes stop_codon:yes gene_type:complete
VRAATPARATKSAATFAVRADGDERLRLHNLSPLPGSRKKPTRKGRGYGAGQVSALCPSAFPRAAAAAAAAGARRVAASSAARRRESTLQKAPLIRKRGGKAIDPLNTFT